MVLAQDQAQRSESEYIEQTIEYRKQQAEYEKAQAEYEKQQAEYEAKIAEEKAKLEEATRQEQERIAAEKAKADAFEAERQQAKANLEKTLAANPYTKADITVSNRGRTVTNPMQDYIDQATRQYNYAIGDINIRESGITLEPIVVKRTASGILSRGGWSTQYVGTGNIHSGYEVAIASANRFVREGKLSPQAYLSTVEQIKADYNLALQAQSARFAKTAQTTFASLRASGQLNAELQQAQSAELIRLGGSGQLVSGAGLGPTMVSQTLTVGTNVADRVPVAPGSAQKAQDFPDEFLSTSEIQAKNLAYFESKGLGDYYQQNMDVAGSVFNTDPRKNWVGSLDSSIPTAPTAPTKPSYSVTSPDGQTKTFGSLAEAERYVGILKSRGLTDVGGQQYQGPPKPMYVVDTGKTLGVTLPTIMGGSYKARAPETITFDTQEKAQAYIDYQRASNPFGLVQAGVIPSQASLKGLETASSRLDQFQQDMKKRSDQGDPLAFAYQVSGVGSLVEIGRTGVNIGISFNNLVTQTAVPFINTSLGIPYQPQKALVQSGETADQTVFPYDFDTMRFKTGGEILTGLEQNIQKYGLLPAVASIGVAYYPGIGAVKAVSPLAKVSVLSKAPIPTAPSVRYALQVPPILKTINPIQVARYQQAGITLFDQGGVAVVPKAVSIGYGQRTITVGSKVGDVYQIGKPNLKRAGVTKAVADISQAKNPQRGIKLAADSTKFEQELAPQVIPIIEGLSEVEIRRAQVIAALQKIATSNKKDTMLRKSLPADAFSTMTAQEQKQVLAIFKKGQKGKTDQFSPYEGSVSQGYFVQEDLLRAMADLDVHGEDYAQAVRMIQRYGPRELKSGEVVPGRIKPSPGRKFRILFKEAQKKIEMISQTKTKIEYTADPLEAEAKNTEFMKSVTDIRYENIQDMAKPGSYLFGFFRPKSRGVREVIKIEKDVDITQIDADRIEFYGGRFFDSKRFQEDVLKHELIHKANPNLSEAKVREFSAPTSDPVDPLGLTKVMQKQGTAVALPSSQKRVGKVMEIMGSDTLDEFGRLDVITGETIFGKPVPTTTYKVKEGVTYGRQRQILKKGESLYSIQDVRVALKERQAVRAQLVKEGKSTVEVDQRIAQLESKVAKGEFYEIGAFAPRAPKDTADFYALVETAKNVEFKYYPGKKAKLGKLIEEFKELERERGFDPEQYLAANRMGKTPDIPDLPEVATSVQTNTAITPYSVINQKKNIIPRTAVSSETSQTDQSVVTARVRTNSIVPQTTESSVVTSVVNRIPTKYNIRSSITSARSVTGSSKFSPRSLVSPRSVTSTSSPRSITSTSSPRSLTSTSSPRSLTSTGSPNSITSTGSPRSTTSTGSPKSTTIKSIPSAPSLPSMPTPPPRPRPDRPKRGLIKIPSFGDEKKVKQPKERKAKDFLGSSRLDNIVGLFNRKAIISGDVASQKQLIKDKKYREKKTKRKSRGKKETSILRIEGAINKGFKI